MGISRARLVWTTAMLAGLAACAGRPAELDQPGPADQPVPPPATLGSVYVLESWGAPPEDTTATFPAYEPRVILVRRGAPDNSVFVELRLPAATIIPPGGRTETSLTLRHRPGQFGLDIELEPGARMEGPAQLLFSYAVHFVMPEAARDRYGTPTAYERGLFVAQLEPSGAVRFLPSRRPASDVIVATISGPGSFVVAAPR